MTGRKPGLADFLESLEEKGLLSSRTVHSKSHPKSVQCRIPSFYHQDAAICAAKGSIFLLVLFFLLYHILCIIVTCISDSYYLLLLLPLTHEVTHALMLHLNCTINNKKIYKTIRLLDSCSISPAPVRSLA
jgi:hypothetical protein